MTLPLFTLPPNWGSATYKVTREYKTDVIPSRSAKEQRRALRHTPRKTIEFTATGGASFLRSMHNQLVRNQAQTLVLPDYSRSGVLSGSVAAGTTAIPLAAIPAWLVNGSTLVLVNGSTMEIATVSSIVGDTVNVTGPLSNGYPSYALVRPGLQGRMATKLSGRRMTTAAGQVQVHFDVKPGSERYDGLIPDAATMFNGREVFLLEPDWANEQSPSFQGLFETLDFGQGLIGYYNPIGFTTRIHSGAFVGRTPDEVDLIEQCFIRMKGQQGEHYMPTWENDLPLKLPTSSIDASLRIDGREVFDSYATDTVHKAVSILMRDGTRIFRQVVSITLVSDGSGTNDTLVNLSASTGRTLSPDLLQSISWLPAWRFATDTLTTEWQTERVARVQLNQQTVEDLAPE
jgi:hypothetical protein